MIEYVLDIDIQQTISFLAILLILLLPHPLPFTPLPLFIPLRHKSVTIIIRSNAKQFILLINNILNPLNSFQINRILKVNQALLLIQIRLFDESIDFVYHVVFQLACLPWYFITNALLLELEAVDALSDGEGLLHYL